MEEASPQTNFTPPVTLKLYLSIVHPILEYGSIVWDLTSSLSSYVESVQCFTQKVIFKSWSSSYSTLLQRLKLDTLSSF